MTREELLAIAKPVLFNTEMVRAILEGRKTVTRRIVKPQPDKKHNFPLGFVSDSTDKKVIGKFGFGIDEYGGSIQHAKPPFKKGDYLYVRETWQECCRNTVHSPIIHNKYCFKASIDSAYYGCIEDCGKICNWKPSIHMPKEAARIFLKVTDVRVERLQDIMKSPHGPNNQVVREGCTYGCDFVAVWESTIKKSEKDTYGWNANPWVWIIEFERVEV